MTDGDRLPEDYGHILPPEKPRRIPSGVVIGIVIVIAFAGGLWYGYHRGVSASKTNGTPPLVKAAPGPTKVTPANPGGVNIPNQKASVYNRLSGNGNPSAVEHLAPPPQQPMAGALPENKSAESQGGETTPGQTGSNQTTGQKSGAAASPAGQPPVTEAPAGTTPASPTTPAPAALSEPPKQTPAPKTEPAKPEQSGKAASSTAKAAANVAKPHSIHRAPAATGIRAQVGAYRSVAEANADWRRLTKRNAALMRGLHPTIRRVDLHGRGVFQRLQAGPFHDLGAARHFCARLKAEGHGCFVVTH